MSVVCSAGADKVVPLSPPIILGLDDALEYIEEDELVEVRQTGEALFRCPCSLVSDIVFLGSPSEGLFRGQAASYTFVEDH